MKIIRGIFIPLITSNFLTFLICTPPYNPFDNIDNVRLLINVPKKPDGYNYCINDKVRFKVTVLFADLVDKVCIHFDENGDKDERVIITNATKNEVIFFEYEYKEKGLKNVKFSLTFRQSSAGRDTLFGIDIGVKPKIRYGKELIAGGDVKLGEPLIFSIEHEEFGRAVYKWYKDSKILSGQDKKSLTFNPLKESDEGQYYCIVITDWGKDQSKIFNLSFKNAMELPKILIHPKSIQPTPWKNARFTIKATGEDIKYQWQKNEKDIIGAHDAFFEVKDLKIRDSATYRCIVSNKAGSDTSQGAIIIHDNKPNLSILDKIDPEIEARDTAVVLNEDEVLTFRLPISDKENNELILIITEPIDETMAELVFPNGKVKSDSLLVAYKPHANKHGMDLFKYQVSDGSNISREAIVSIKIIPIDDKPAISLLSPPNGVTKISLDSQKLSYLSKDLDEDGICHSILISEDSSQITNTSFRVDNVTEQAITIGNVFTPKGATKYYWLVIAYDNSTDRLADTSEIRTFWTKNSKPVWTFNNFNRDTSKYYLDLDLNNYCKDPDGHSIQFKVLKGANTVIKENLLRTRADSQLVKVQAIDNFPAQPCTSEAEFIYYYKDPLMKFVPAGSIIDDKGYTAFISKGFWIDSTEVTQKEYKRVIGANPSIYIGDQKPVDNVTWFMAIMYCNKKSKIHGTDTVYSYESISDTHALSLQCHWDRFGYRLPTEDEWELACDGGEKTDFFWGDSWSISYPETPAEKENIDKFTWWSGNNEPEGTKNVATKLPNKIGLYDLPGNVKEWCWDWHNLWTCIEGCNGRVNNRTDYKGATHGKERVAKGGDGYRSGAKYLQTSGRDYRQPIFKDSNRGFRVVIRSK